MATFIHVTDAGVCVWCTQPGPFEIIQVRVQKFLGRIGGYSHLLVGDVNLLQVAGTGGLAWDPVSRVKFTLPFREEKPDIWLGDIFLSFTFKDRGLLKYFCTFHNQDRQVFKMVLIRYSRQRISEK